MEGCILNEIALGFNSLAELHFTEDNFGDCSHRPFVRLCKSVNMLADQYTLLGHILSQRPEAKQFS